MTSNAAVQEQGRPNAALGSASSTGKKKIDRQSWNYIVKSGIAGGLAGCAVRIPLVLTLISSRDHSALTTALPG